MSGEPTIDTGDTIAPELEQRAREKAGGLRSRDWGGVVVCDVVPSGAVAAALVWIWEHSWNLEPMPPPPGAVSRHRVRDSGGGPWAGQTLVVTVYRSGKVTLQGTAAAQAARRLPPLVTPRAEGEGG